MSDKMSTKLAEILIGFKPDAQLSDISGVVDFIDQAYQDAGAVLPNEEGIYHFNHKTVRVDNSNISFSKQGLETIVERFKEWVDKLGLMTSKEWYDHFYREYRLLREDNPTHHRDDNAIEAARRVAGIGDK